MATTKTSQVTEGATAVVTTSDKLSASNAPSADDYRSPRPPFHTAKVYSVSDFTSYVKEEEYRERFSECLLTEKKRHHSGNMTVRSDTEQMHYAKGRTLACSCFRGEWVSITMRVKGNLKIGDGEIDSGRDLDADRRKQYDIPPVKLEHSNYREQSKETNFKNETLGPPSHLHELLYDLLLKDKPDPQGIIVVAGSTSSGKTTAVQGLIDNHLYRLVKESGKKVLRRPHLVTFEDPIQDLAWDSPEEANTKGGIDYTPREKEIDASKLQEALEDALRQKPAVVYISEIRDNDDWPHVIEFAGTGHLVVATTHAGSVTECMKKIFTAMKVNTAVDRNVIGAKILGIAHIKPYDIPVEFERRVYIPALWRSTPNGLNSLVADGLASILPFNPKDDWARFSSLGRLWFTKKLLEKGRGVHDELTEGKGSAGNALYEKVKTILVKKATEWDLEEM